MRFPTSFPALVIFAALIAGTLDILSACVYFTIVTDGQPLSHLFAYISSGVFGRDAFGGHPAIAWWGLLFHYIIAFIWTFIFMIIYPKIPDLRKHPVATGVVYGFIVWSVMQFVVLPLSHVPHGPLRLTHALINIAILMVMIGLPLSFIARRYYTKD